MHRAFQWKHLHIFVAKTLQEPDSKIKSSICLTVISPLGGLPSLLAEGRTCRSSCAFLFIQRCCLFRHCLLWCFPICFRRLLSSLWGSSFPVSLTILAEWIDGATSEGINCLLAAEAFQSNGWKQKAKKSGCASGLLTAALQASKLSSFPSSPKALHWGVSFLQVFSPPYRLSAPVS